MNLNHFITRSKGAFCRSSKLGNNFIQLLWGHLSRHGNDGAKATGEGPNICQAPSCSVKGLSPNEGIVTDAFRPAWAS